MDVITRFSMPRMTPQVFEWPAGCYAADPGKYVPCLRPQAERAGVRMEARQGQDARPAGGLIHDSRAPRATLIQALFVQEKLRGGGEAIVQSLAHLGNCQGTRRPTYLAERQLLDFQGGFWGIRKHFIAPCSISNCAT